MPLFVLLILKLKGTWAKFGMVALGTLIGLAVVAYIIYHGNFSAGLFAP